MLQIYTDPDAQDPRDILSGKLRSWWSAGTGHDKGTRETSKLVSLVRSIAEGSSGFSCDLTAASGDEPSYGGAGEGVNLHVPFRFTTAGTTYLVKGSLQWPVSEASFIIIGSFPIIGNNGICQVRNTAAASGALYLYRYSDQFSFQAQGTSGGLVEVRTTAGSVVSNALTWIRCDLSGTTITVSTEGSINSNTVPSSLDLTQGSNQTTLYLGRALSTYMDGSINDFMILDTPPTAGQWANMIEYFNREYQQNWTG